MKSLASFVLCIVSALIPPRAHGQVFPETGHSNDNGGIFGIGPDIVFSGFISLDKISGTLGLGSEFPPLDKLLHGVNDILTSNQKSGGTGPYPAKWFTDAELPYHTIYAPAQPRDDVELPVIVWGNGFCFNIGNLFQPFLQEIASHGYLVIASGPPLPNVAVDPLTLISTPGSLSKSIQLAQAIDFVYAGKAGKFGNVAISRIAAAGQSCGGQEAYSASYHDPRVTLTMLFNSGVFIPARRYPLSELTAPVAYFCGGPIDLAYEISLADYALLPEDLPSLWASLDTGHIGTYFAENGGKDTQAAVAFLQWWFRGDQAARAKFVDPASAGSLYNEDWNITMKNIV